MPVLKYVITQKPINLSTLCHLCLCKHVLQGSDSDERRKTMEMGICCDCRPRVKEAHTPGLVCPVLAHQEWGVLWLGNAEG